MFELGILDGNGNGVSSDLFMKNMQYFDFPMESLEGDDLDEEYWNAKFQAIVPIISDALAGSSLAAGDNSENAASVVVPYLSDPSEEPVLKSLPNSVEAASEAITPLQNSYSDGSKSAAIQSPSPVSVLGSNSSSSSGNSYGILTRSKHLRCSTINNSHCFFSVSTEESSRSNESPKFNTLTFKRKLKMENIQTYVAAKKCSHCEAKKTPQWREGPMGPKTLCNACGVRYRSGRLLPNYRPAASPAFVPSVHSNSHKKVAEMKEKAIQDGRGLVPVPSEALMGSSMASGGNVGNASLVVVPSLSDPSEEPELKSPPNSVDEATEEIITLQNNNSYGTESTPSPVSVLGSGNPCSSENSYGILRRSKRLRFSSINYLHHRFSASKYSCDTLSVKRKPKKAIPSSVGAKKCSSSVKGKLKKEIPGSVAAKKCSHCESTKTPQWREGPMGRNTLCNACGVRYRSGRLFPEYRPAASPTFVPSLHSNLDKKVGEMREKAIQEGSHC